MAKQIVHTSKAPAVGGPYSQAVIANGFVFAAGQVGTIPGEGRLADGGIEGQARQVLKNLAAVLEAAGSSLDHVVKTTVFLANIEDFAKLNAVYAEFFPANPPARSTFQVGRLPIGALVEIEAIAILKD